MPEITDANYVVPPEVDGIVMGAADQGSGARAATWSTEDIQKSRLPVTLAAAGNLPLTSKFNLVICNVSANTTFTVPPVSTEAWPPGTFIDLYRPNATGEITVAAGAGVTLRSRGNLFRLNAQWSVARLRMVATNEWVLSGDLKA